MNKTKWTNNIASAAHPCRHSPTVLPHTYCGLCATVHAKSQLHASARAWWCLSCRIRDQQTEAEGLVSRVADPLKTNTWKRVELLHKNGLSKFCNNARNTIQGMACAAADKEIPILTASVNSYSTWRCLATFLSKFRASVHGLRQNKVLKTLMWTSFIH